MQTPVLVLPSTPASGAQATPVLTLDDPHFEGESPGVSLQNAPHTPSPSTPDFDPRPMELQCIWGTTPTFFRSIPIDLP